VSAAVTVRLPADQLDQLVERVSERLCEQVRTALAGTVKDSHSTGALLSASALAEALGLSRSWVYEHADELGAMRIGSGSKARLRFDAEQARMALSGPTDRFGSKRSDPADTSPRAKSRASHGRGRRSSTTGRPLPAADRGSLRPRPTTLRDARPGEQQRGGES
jgi:hypothetical protein